MKTCKWFALVLAGFLMGQSITADDLVISPTVLEAIEKIGEDINKLPVGSDGVIGPIQTSIGEEFANKLRGICEATLKNKYPGITLYGGDQINRILGLNPNGHYTGEEIKDFLSALGGPEWWIAGHVTDDGKFYIDLQGLEGDENESGRGSLGIPFSQDELFKLITDLSVPPIPNCTLINLNGEVYGTAYNRDGDIVAVTTVGGGVFVYNTYTRKLIKTIREAGPKAIPSYYMDNQLLLAEDTGTLCIIGNNKEVNVKIAENPLSAIDVSTTRGRCYLGHDGSVTVFDLEKRIILNNFEGVAGKVEKIVLCKDEKTVVVRDQEGIGLWNSSDGKKIQKIKNSEDVNAFDVDQAGNIVVAKLNKIFVYQKDNEKFSDVFKAPGQPGGDAEITSLKFSPNGAYVLSGNKAGLVVMWHVKYLLGMHSLENHIAPVTSISYRNDGSQYITGGFDSHIYFYDGTPAEPSGNLKIINNTDTAVAIRINQRIPKEGPNISSNTTKNFQKIPLGNTEITIYDPSGLIIDASGKRYAYLDMTKNGYTITLLREAVPELDFNTEGRQIPSSLAVHDGNLTITTRASTPGKSDPGHADIVTLNINDGVMTAIGDPIEQHRKNINASAWCGKLYITGADDGIRFFENDRLETILDIELCENLAVSADGKYLTASSSSSGIKIWDIPARKLIRKIHGDKAVFHDGSIVYVRNEKEIIRESIKEGERLPVFPNENALDVTVVLQMGINNLRIGYKDTILVFRKDGFIEVRNAGPATPLIIPGKSATQNSNGLLAVSLTNGEIQIFEVETGLLNKTLYAHNAIITDLVFITDDLLASASRDGSVKLLNIINANEEGKVGIFEDKQRIFIKSGKVFGDTIHVKNGE